MHFVKFAFRFVEAINPMAFEAEEGQKLYNEMYEKYQRVQIDPKQADYKDDIKTKFVIFTLNPFVRFFMAGSFQVFVKLFKDWQNGRWDDNHENEQLS